MPPEIETHAEQARTQLAQEFDPWRQHRRTRFARMPPPWWEQAIALNQERPIAQMAKRFHLRGRDVKKRCATPPAAVAEPAPCPVLGFVDVTPSPAWPCPPAATEGALQRAAGAAGVGSAASPSSRWWPWCGPCWRPPDAPTPPAHAEHTSDGARRFSPRDRGPGGGVSPAAAGAAPPRGGRGLPEPRRDGAHTAGV